MTGRRLAQGASGLGLAGTLALFFRALFLGETFVERDLSAYYRPAKALLVRLVHEAGGIPLWNPYFSFGQPFAANPEHELFHPATSLLLLLPFEWAFRLPIVVAPALGGLGMLFFLRTTGRGRDAALVGAISWGFGGYLLSTANLLPILYAVLPLPFALAFLLRTWRSGAWRDAAGLAVFGGLVGLAGEPSTLVAAAALGGVTLLADGTRTRPRRTSALVAAVLLACAIAAPALLPAALHARATVRAGGLPADLAGLWSFPPSRLGELLLPRLLGHVEVDDPAWYWGRTLYPDRGAPFLLGIYPGLLATLLACAAAVRRNRRTLVWSGAALLSVVAAAGSPFLLWSGLHALPFFSGLRYPEKLLLVACFALVVLAAAGWDLLRFGGLRRNVRRALFLFAAAAAAAAIGLTFVAGPVSLVPASLAPLFAGIVRRDLLLAAVSAALCGAALGAGRAARPWLASGVLLAELCTVGAALVRTRPEAGEWRPAPVLAPLVSARLDGPVVNLLLDAEVTRRIRAVRFLSEPKPAQWGIATALGADFDLTNLRWTTLATELFWRAVAADPPLLAPLLARRGVAALVVPRRGADGTIRMAVVRPSGRRPFAFFAGHAERLASDADWLPAVRRLGPALVDTILLSEEAPVPPPRPGTGSVSGIERTPDEVVVDAAVDEGPPGLLAVNQTWDPGWEVSIDGAHARLLRAEVGLSAVAVPPGRHRVVLRYRNAAVFAGLLLGGSALLVTLLLARLRDAGAGRALA